MWGHLPHQLLVVEGQRGLPAKDVHLALEDRHLHFPFHTLLGLGDAVPDEFTLGAVPETCGRKQPGCWGGPLCWGLGLGVEGGHPVPPSIMADLGGGEGVLAPSPLVHSRTED